MAYDYPDAIYPDGRKLFLYLRGTARSKDRRRRRLGYHSGTVWHRAQPDSVDYHRFRAIFRRQHRLGLTTSRSSLY